MIPYNNSIIVPVDTGYGNIKNSLHSFPTGIAAYKTKPAFDGKILHIGDMYYRIGEGHKEYIPDKTVDEEFRLLTIAAICDECRSCGYYEGNIYLAVGCPTTMVTAQRESTREYFLKEPHISTSTYKKALQNNVTMTGTNVDFILEGVNKYLMALAKEQIKIAFEQSQKEVDNLHQRTREGIATARLNGKQIGQKQGAKLTTKKSIEAKEKIRKYSKDFNGFLSDADCMQMTKLARNTYYKYKREIKAE